MRNRLAEQVRAGRMHAIRRVVMQKPQSTGAGLQAALFDRR
jgi:hypothetical protein